jgi:hypothetical protein
MLTHRKEKFIKCIIQGKNPTEAARECGYSVKGTAQVASRLMRDVDVVTALTEFREQEKAKLTKESFVAKALGDYNALEIDSRNRPRNLEIVGKALGYLTTDTTSKNINQTLNVQINSVSLENKTTEELWSIARQLLANE